MSNALAARRAPSALALVFALAAFVSASAPARAQQQQTGSPNVVISQIYTRGGEAGATFRSDYVEFFNRGQQSVDLRDYKFFFNDGTNTTLGLSFVGSFAFPLQAGQHLLIELQGGANGAPLPVASDSFGAFPLNLGATRGWVAVARSTAQLPANGCPTGADIVDVVGYGTSVCAEGTAAAAPSPTTAALRLGGGCNDTDANAADFESATPNPRNTQSAFNFCAAAGQSVVRLVTTSVTVPETTTAVEVRVERTGDTSAPATVDYATSDAHAASERSDFTLALGTLRFAAGETEKTITLLLNDDAHNEGFEFFELTLSNPSANAVVSPVASTLRVNIQNNDFNNTPPPNPADTSAFFVRQHYHDFLNREPDAAGLQFWTNEIEQCGADAQCREVKRINVSAAFFLSIEFQNTGFLVHRLYRAALPPPPSGRPRGLPRLREFVRDAQEIGRGVVVGQDGWEALLEANTREFVERFTQRTDFLARYPQTMTAAEYVDALNAHAASVAGVATILTPTQRDAFIAGLQNNTETRASVLRKLAEHQTFTDAERNGAFVLMQYIGYLRRHPLDPPDSSFAGYDFWLGKLNSFNGNFVDAEMVKAFITSIEYRQRFGQ